jgi:hypothetical protein
MLKMAMSLSLDPHRLVAFTRKDLRLLVLLASCPIWQQEQRVRWLVVMQQRRQLESMPMPSSGLT